jgi:hypothetical protein
MSHGESFFVRKPTTQLTLHTLASTDPAVVVRIDVRDLSDRITLPLGSFLHLVSFDLSSATRDCRLPNQTTDKSTQTVTRTHAHRHTHLRTCERYALLCVDDALMLVHDH